MVQAVEQAEAAAVAAAEEAAEAAEAEIIEAMRAERVARATAAAEALAEAVLRSGGRRAEEEARRERAEQPYSDVQYWERLPERLRVRIAAHPVLRLFVRHARVERPAEGVLAEGSGVKIGMEQGERAKMAVPMTKHMLKLALALHGAIGFHDAVATNGSDDNHAAEAAGEAGQQARVRAARLERRRCVMAVMICYARDVPCNVTMNTSMTQYGYLPTEGGMCADAVDAALPTEGG